MSPAIAIPRGAAPGTRKSFARALRRGATLAALLTGAALAAPAAATQFELQAGRSYMDSYPTTALFAEAVLPDRPVGQTRFTWAPDVALGWIDGRDIGRYRGNPYGTRRSVWLAAAGARFHYGDAGDWYHHLFFSEQLAAQTPRTLALSSHYEFVTTVGWQADRFSLRLRHASNAGLDGPNRGETMLLFGVAFGG